MPTYNYTAADSIASINAGEYVEGDILLFNRGDTWVGRLAIGVSGITFGAYGTGAKPIITTRKSLTGWDTALNWEDQGGNVWKWASIPNPHDKNWRFWLNGVEYAQAETGAGVTSVKRTSHSRNDFHFYVYATSNPATFYTDIEYAGSEQQTFNTMNQNFLTIENIDFRGGMGACIDIDFSNNLIIQDCSIGWDTNGMGIRSNGTCNDNIIRRNTIDAGDRFVNDFENEFGIRDGIYMTGGCNRWQIYHNRIRDWGHSNIDMTNLTATAWTDNEIYENWFSAESVDYCRGMSVNSLVDTVATGNKIFRNLFENHSVRIQLNLPGLEFYNNIVNNTRNSAIRDFGTGQGLDISGYSDTSPIDMKIYNNVFANNAEAGLLMKGGLGDYIDAVGNLIRNNIFYNNGHSSVDGLADYQIVIADDVDVGANTFENNLFFPDSVYYGHDPANSYPKTTAQFNAANGTASDVITGNIAGDPLFGEGFTLSELSPAIGAGLNLGVEFQDALSADSVWPLNVVTEVQTEPWDIGAYKFISSSVPNLLANSPHVAIAKQDILFSAVPEITAESIAIIYLVGSPLISYIPGRSINGITGFELEKGYYIVSLADIDLSEILIPPL